MEHTQVVFSNSVNGEVQLFSNDKKAGIMSVALANGKLTVYHTEVYDEFKGRGFSKLLLEQLLNYAKENGVKVVPLCPYVNAQFRRHPADYAAIWFKEGA